VMASMRSIFNEYAGEGGVLEGEAATEALEHLEESDSVSALRSRPASRAGPSRQGSMTPAAAGRAKEPLTFDQFVEEAERRRDKRAKVMRKRAGFSEEEIEHFQELFDAHDTQKDGTLEVSELTKLLTTLGFKLRTAKEQKEISNMLEDAKVKADEQGVAANGEVNFWVVVQLLRTLHKKGDRSEMDRVAKATQESRFSPGEAAEFQEVFMSWYETDLGVNSEEHGDEEMQMGGRPSDEGGRKALTNASMVRLFRSLGMKIDSRHRAMLDAQIDEIAERDRVEFPEFLRLMRWATDTNFADVSKVVPQAGGGDGAGEN